jgi:hypothetical protein
MPLTPPMTLITHQPLPHRPQYQDGTYEYRHVILDKTQVSLSAYTFVEA